MHAIGIIAEYNPFHNGHAYHVAKARQISGLEAVVAVMSGGFTQRGEAAVLDKWTRARMAVSSGVDLVLELPAAFATRSAQPFAAGGVRLLQATGVAARLAFGVEDDDAAALWRAAAAAGADETSRLFRRYTDAGLSYAAAQARATAETAGLPEGFLLRPNNILAVEYMKALSRFAPAVVPLPIARYGARHRAADITGPLASAAAIRKRLRTAGDADDPDIRRTMPPAAAAILRRCCAAGRGPAAMERLTEALLLKLRFAGLDGLRRLPGVAEGLEYKIAAAALAAVDRDDLLARLKSKRYPYTRLQRILLHALLPVTAAQLADFDQLGPLYARVLAFNRRGRSLLKTMQKTASIPIITKTTAFLNSGQRARPNALTPLQAMLALDTYAADLHALTLPGRRGGLDFTTSPACVDIQ